MTPVPMPLFGIAIGLAMMLTSVSLPAVAQGIPRSSRSPIPEPDAFPISPPRVTIGSSLRKPTIPDDPFKGQPLKDLADRLKPLGPGLRPRLPFGPNANLPAANMPNESPEEAINPGASGGLRIQLGELEYPADTRLAVRDQQGNRVVGKYHVGSGNSRIVLMPDGQLQVFDAAATEPTALPFEPLSMDEVRDRWLADERLAGLNMKTTESRRFVFLYNTSEPFIHATRTILETMYPAVRKYFSRTSVQTHEPELPLVIIAFATEDQYQEFKRMPSGVIAYYDAVANHVTLFEQSRLSQVAPEVAIKNAISTIAHEGVHQILHNIGVQQRLSRWPMWLSEGLPEFFAPTSTAKNAHWKGLGATNDLRMKEVVEDLKQGPRLGSGNRLSRLVELKQLDSLDYAYSWGLIHLMARKHRKELFACIDEASRCKPLSHLADTSAMIRRGNAPTGDRRAGDQPSGNLFTRNLGDDFAAMEKELSMHLASLRWVDPAENQTHYLVVSGSSIVLTTSPQRVQELRNGTLPLQTFRVKAFPNRSSALRAMQSIAR